MMYELQPTNGRKSFGRKAIVYDDGKTAQLRSYDTIVAEVTYWHPDKAVVYGWYSSTTAIHINTFLDKYWFKTMTREEMECDRETKLPARGTLRFTP